MGDISKNKIAVLASIPLILTLIGLFSLGGFTGAVTVGQTIFVEEVPFSVEVGGGRGYPNSLTFQGWPGETVVKTVEVSNGHSFPVTVTSAAYGTPGAWLAPAAVSLAPGERKKIRLAITLPATHGSYKGLITLTVSR